MKLPPPETLLNGLYVKYFEHSGKVCLMTSRNGIERYTVWDNSPWYKKEEFFKRY